jgi:hypothetical protein
MESSRLNQEELIAEEKGLEKLRKVVQSVSTDGVINETERGKIWAALQTDDKVTAEELELVRTLIFDGVVAKKIGRDCPS